MNADQVGHCVKIAITKSGIEVGHLATMLGVTRQTINNHMRGHGISVPNMCRVAEACGMDIFEFLKLADKADKEQVKLKIAHSIRIAMAIKKISVYEMSCYLNITIEEMELIYRSGTTNKFMVFQISKECGMSPEQLRTLPNIDDNEGTTNEIE